MSKLLYFTQALVEASLALLLINLSMLLAQYVEWNAMFSAYE